MASKDKKNYTGKGGSNSKRRGGKGRQDARAFRSGMESADSIDKWDRSRSGRDQSQCAKANDWRWYAFNEQLLRDSASFAYSWPIGGKLNTGLLSLDARSVPGIMAFKTVPAFGQSLDGTSALNTASRNIYSYVRHANAGHTNYEAPDLMLYIMAMDSVDSFAAFMKRIYGLINLYTYENRFYPDALLMAMGVDPADFRQHIADFRAFINMFIVRVGSMCVPTSLAYNARHMWMYDNIYVDSDTAKAQTYFYTPDGFYMYQLDATGKGMLKYTQLVADDDLLTVAELEAFGLALINPILTSEDMNIMSGDILKAFQDGGVIKRTGVSETYQVFPVYNEEVMSQFENITMMTPFNPQTGSLEVQTYSPHLYQVITENAPEGAEGYLYYNPSFLGESAFIGGQFTWSKSDRLAAYGPYTCDRMINMHKNEVSPADTMVATRLTNICKLDDADGSMFSTTIGSDICTRAVIWEYRMNSSGQWVPYRLPDVYSAVRQYVQGVNMGSSGSAESFNSGVTTLQISESITNSASTSSVRNVVNAHFSSTVTAVSQFAELVAALAKFDWHPAVYSVAYLQTDTYNVSTTQAGVVMAVLRPASMLVSNVIVSNIIYDVDKYAIINEQGLKKMTEVALLSMFSVPQMGAFARKL